MAINTTYKVTKGSPESLISLNKISDQDLPLIQRLELDTVFDPTRNRLDVFFYALDGRYLSSIIDSRSYSVVRGGSRNVNEIEDITLNPEKDSINGGYPNGDVNVLYNFINNLLSDRNTQPKLFVESISPDRTEIRALTNDVSAKNIVRFIDTIKSRLNDSSYFEDFRLNFGRNQLLIGINIDRIEYNDSQAVIIKLYEPLPGGINVKDTFLLEELVGDSVLYQVVTEVSQTFDQDQFNLRGPNYDVELVEENNNPTGYLNYDELFSYPVTNSYYEVYSLFNEKGAQISIDHTNFEDFIQFSSAEERLRNFYYKASLLENYRNQINSRTLYTASLVENIKGIVSNFDHYDRYLYYETGSWAWPKSSATRPFELHSTGSTKVNNWYTNIILSASNYDLSNQDRLVYSIPSFIRDDSNNASYALFTDMIGQHFDNLWIYSKAVTDKFDADNRLEFGISKDLVRDAIENFGIKLYNNNEALENLFSAFTGETYNTGSESTVTSLIVAVEGSGSLTGSVGNEHLQPMPKSSYQKEVYKRIYHNIPLLLKSKGTERGLRALINTFGIPPDVLTIKTFGGADTSTTPFYGPNVEVTSSLGKIRVSNTDTVVTGSTLSNYTSVVNPGKDYSTDLHTVEIGFSPANNLDTFIKTHPSMSAFDIDSYIGDPGYAYSGSYAGLNQLAETVFTSGSTYAGVYNAFDFVRLIKFFDNSIFRIIKDFVPARSNISTGIVIKPHILDRSKIKQPEVKWSNQSARSFKHSATNLDFTGSYYGTNFSLDGEVDTAFTTGSSGLDSKYTSSYTEVHAMPSGGFSTLTRNNHSEASYTGEYSGSILKVSTGDLTKENIFKKLKPKQFSFKYIPRNDFSSPESIYLESIPPTFISAETSASIVSPPQGTDTLVLSSITPDSRYTANSNPIKYSFILNGGPNAGLSPVADSGSIQIAPLITVESGQALAVDTTVKFTDIDKFNLSNANSQDKAKVIFELISGSTIADTVVFTRESLGAEEYTKTLTFTNTSSGPLLGELYGDWHLRVRYHSKYETPDPIYSLTDATIFAKIRTVYSDKDAITLWIKEIPTSTYTSSLVQAIAVPLESTTNGTMTRYLEEAKEIVFEYESFEITDNYSGASVTSSVDGGSYRANITIDNDDILLSHVTSAPYSASFRQPLPDLSSGDNIQFKFIVDFDSYWNSYLNTSSGENTPFVTASIRNSTTLQTVAGLSSSYKQGEYPKEYKDTLIYENTTGGTLSDLEFYYQVNVPKADKGAGNPKVNLKDININYRTAKNILNKANILSSQRLTDVFYLDIDPDVEVYSGSLSYFQPTTNYYKVGFLPGSDTKFKFNNYASTSNNIDSLRRSNTRLIVDEKTYTPTQGAYRGFFLPGNYAILSSSIADGLNGIDERQFAEVQDSNYYATGWRNGRYDGTEINNISKGSSVLGQEPALTYKSFNSSIFPSTGVTADIKAIYPSSEEKIGDTEVYFTTYRVGSELSDGYTYHSNKEYVQQTDISSYAFDNIGPANVVTATATDFEVNTSSGADGVIGRYSGSLGSANEGDNYIVSFKYIFTDESPADANFSVALVNINNGSAIELISQSLDSNYDNTVRNFQGRFTADADYTEVGIRINANISLQSNADEAVDIGFNNITIQKIVPASTDLLPFSYFEDIILSSSTYQKTKFYRKIPPTPSNPTGYEALTLSKIYRFDNSTVYTTNENGIVTNIE